VLVWANFHAENKIKKPLKSTWTMNVAAAGLLEKQQLRHTGEFAFVSYTGPGGTFSSVIVVADSCPPRSFFCVDRENDEPSPKKSNVATRHGDQTSIGLTCHLEGFSAPVYQVLFCQAVTFYLRSVRRHLLSSRFEHPMTKYVTV
jgi:hypothetical protein